MRIVSNGARLVDVKQMDRESQVKTKVVLPSSLIGGLDTANALMAQKRWKKDVVITRFQRVMPLARNLKVYWQLAYIS